MNRQSMIESLERKFIGYGVNHTERANMARDAVDMFFDVVWSAEVFIASQGENNKENIKSLRKLITAIIRLREI